MSGMFDPSLVSLALLLGGALFTFQRSQRSDTDVFIDLNNIEPPDSATQRIRDQEILTHPLASAGLLTSRERERFYRRGRFYPPIGIVISLALYSIFFQGGTQLLLPAALVGFSGGYLVAQRR